MKTVVLLLALVGLALSGTVPYKHHVKTKTVDKEFVEHQKIIIALFDNVIQTRHDTDYFKIGKDYDVEANIDNYTNKAAVEHFLKLYKSGFLPKSSVFSIFYDEMREQAISLYLLFYYAKDYDTLFKTAAFARVHINDGMFVYSFYVALTQRMDTKQFVLPAPYEIFPNFFLNRRERFNIYRTKEQNELPFPEMAKTFGIVQEDGYVFYTNYSDSLSYPNNEVRLAYFMEDIGLNSYYYKCHALSPFWWNGDNYGAIKERRGEYYFFFYQQLLARFYLERLSNGLGEIPSFSWFESIKDGYYPLLSTSKTPFAQRSNNYPIHNAHNYEEIRFLDIFEKTFFQFLQKGHFKSFNQEMDFHDPKAINFVGNYWQTNADLFGENYTQTYQRSYDITARRILGGAPKPFDKYTFLPSALDFYQTTLRDPISYQLYNKIFDYMVQYKQHLTPYNYDDLHFGGVKIENVEVSKMETFFELYDYNAVNSVFFPMKEKPYLHKYNIRQPRLNHKPFTVSIDIKSEVATDAIIKIWIGPKYNSDGFPMTLEQNWMNFVELDWFSQKLMVGENKIVRNSKDFFLYSEDPLPIHDVWNLLEQRKMPDMEKMNAMPSRLMLPRGTKGGFPYQLFVGVFPQNAVKKESESFKEHILYYMSDKQIGFPLDRPPKHQYFMQPNMFFEDVEIYHDGEMHPYHLTTPWITWEKKH